MKKYLTGILLIAALKGAAQQDPQYSLYQFNQLVINPAYAGARDAIAVVADLRKQWAGINGSPTTGAISVHSPVLNKKLGVGLSVISDKLGPKSITSVYGNFAYIAKLSSKLKLSFGVRAGYSNYKFNYNDIKYQDPGNETALADLSSSNRGALDVDAGVFLRGNKFFVGLSGTHLNSGRLYNKTFSAADPVTGTINDYSLSYSLQPHLFLVAGKTFVVNEDFLIAPSIMFKLVKGARSFDINFNVFVKKRVWLGVFMRRDYGPGALFQFYVSDKFRIGYAYDTGLSDKRKLGGSHEIMIGYDFIKSKSKMVSPRFL